MMFLEAFQDAEKRSGLSGVRGDAAVRKALLFERERGLARNCSHDASNVLKNLPASIY
jgi:hypothetical protein